MRQIASTAIVAVIVSLLTLTVAGAVAQAPAEQAITPAARSNINAHRVDGKHAISYTSRKAIRRNKLVATNRQGELPSNIVRPLWGYIKNKPGILADHQITWNEVAGKPPGFADGVDNIGPSYASMIVEEWTSPVPPQESRHVFLLNQPRNIDFRFSVIPTAVDAYMTVEEVLVERNPDGTLTYYVGIKNDDGVVSSGFKLRATAFGDGIAPAALRKALKTAKVRVARK